MGKGLEDLRRLQRQEKFHLHWEKSLIEREKPGGSSQAVVSSGFSTMKLRRGDADELEDMFDSGHMYQSFPWR